MAQTLMRAPTQYNTLDIRVGLRDDDHADFRVHTVEIGEGGALVLRDGQYAVVMAFSPHAWTEVFRR